MKSNKKGLIVKWKPHIKDSFNYITESRNYIYFIVALFFLSGIIGFVFSSQLNFLDNFIRNIIEKTSDLRGINLILYIFSNNLGVAFGTLFFGIVFGIIPLINVISNGLILGYVFSKTYAVSGISDFWRILPHGIFELPAIFISLGLGLKMGAFFFSKNPRKEFNYRIANSIKTFVFVVAPLLVLAAIIEGLLIILTE